MDLTADLLGIADVSRRALSHVYMLINSWRSAPDQLRQLENDVTRLSNLLDTVREAGNFHIRLGNTAAAKALNRDVILARDSLESIQSTLRDVVGDADRSLLPGRPAIRSSASDTPQRLRWMSKKEELALAQRSLRLSCQQILCRLVILNMEVSAEVLTTTRRHASVSSDRYEHIDSKIDGISSQVHHLAHWTMQKDSGLSGRGPSAPFTAFPNQIGEKDRAQAEIRVPSNESRFQHLEDMFANVTAPLAATPDQPENRLGLDMTPQKRTAPRLGCACHCRCHRHLTRPLDLKLSTFRTALGSLSFGFSSQVPSQITCDVNTCRRTRARWIRITYTLPAWLFHATITSVLSNTTGPVEFVLRVCRRIPPHSVAIANSIYGYVRRGDTEQVKLILQAKEGAVTDIKGDIGRSVLHTALLSQDLDMVKLLCQEGADWFQEQDDGLAPYQYALRLLFANPRMSDDKRRILRDLMPFDIAIERAELSDLHMVVLRVHCLDLGPFLRLRSCPVNTCDSQGKTPLYYAAAIGDVAAVRTLLEAGAEPDFCGWRKPVERPLHVACQFGHIDIVKTLVAAGADVDAPDSYERTPLMLLSTRHSDNAASDKRHEDELAIRMAEYLLQCGANPLAEDAQRDTVLDHLATKDLAAVGEHLLTHHRDIDINHRDWEGTTPLGNAIAFRSLNMIAMLLHHGADPRSVDGNGLTMLHHIANYGDVKTVGLFVRLAETGVLSGLGLDSAAMSHANMTPLQTLDVRLDVSKHMRDLFQRLLKVLAMSPLGVYSEVDSVEKIAGDVEKEEFYDASEFVH